MKNNTAIIVVDVQNDFLPGGALAVKGGLAIIPVINKLFDWIPNTKAYFSQDWHPLGTAHFDKWPVHCVAGSKGADIVDGLPKRDGDVVIRKGQGMVDDGYSAFDGTTLADLLLSSHVTSLYVCGLAGDYCVKETVLDALKLGFHVTLVLNAIAAVDQKAGVEALDEMARNGASTMFL